MSNKYSYSKIDCYKQCPFAFKLKYEDGHYISADAIALEVGILIHETEEAIANAIKNKEVIDYIKLKNNIILKMNKIEHKFPNDFIALDKSDRTYKDKIYEYLTSGIYRLEKYMKDNPTYEIVGAEVSFNVIINNQTFTGKIDRVIRDTATNKYICHDVKTYSVEVAKENLVTPLQFVVYVEAMKKLYNITEDQIICGYDLPFCNIIQQAGTNGFIKRGLEKICKLLNSIDKKDWTPNPSPLCAFCSYSLTNENANIKYLKENNCFCPYYSHWTREHKVFSVENEWYGIETLEQLLEDFKAKHLAEINLRLKK